MSVTASPPTREAKLMPIDLEINRHDGGVITLRSRIPLQYYDANLPAALIRRCAAMGDKPALAKRAPGGGDWVFTTYAHLGQAVQATAQWLLDHVPAGRTVMIATDNTPAFAVMSFAAWAAGLPVCPVSTAYGTLGGDHGRLKHVIAKVHPAIIFAEDAAPMAAALNTLDLGDAVIVTRSPHHLEGPSVDFADVLETPVTEEVRASIASRRPDDLAALMQTLRVYGLAQDRAHNLR